MKVQCLAEWRKKEEPEFTPEVVIERALKQAGYHVCMSSYIGDVFEDKTKIPFDRDGERLPHEEIAK
jgi:hypothetical protein